MSWTGDFKFCDRAVTSTNGLGLDRESVTPSRRRQTTSRPCQAPSQAAAPTSPPLRVAGSGPSFGTGPPGPGPRAAAGGTTDSDDHVSGPSESIANLLLIFHYFLFGLMRVSRPGFRHNLKTTQPAGGLRPRRPARVEGRVRVHFTARVRLCLCQPVHGYLGPNSLRRIGVTVSAVGSES